jgi:hypothetical protein
MAERIIEKNFYVSGIHVNACIFADDQIFTCHLELFVDNDNCNNANFH